MQEPDIPQADLRIDCSYSPGALSQSFPCDIRFPFVNFRVMMKRLLFEYTTLRNPDSDVRVIELRPSRRRSADLICKIRVFPIRKMPEYTALSYAWGDQSQKRPIVVDGAIL